MKNKIQAILLSITAITAIVLLEIGCSASTEAYYVSLQGDDNDPGTKEKPFKSLQKLNTLQLKPGSKIYLKGGEIFQGTLKFAASGSNDSAIVITSYNNEKGNAIIDGGISEAIVVNGSHFQISNLSVKGAGRKNGNTTSGISLKAASFGIVENIKAEGFQKSGIELTSCKKIDLKNIQAENNGFSGIYIIGTKENRSTNILVKDCKAENNPGDPTVLDNHSGNGILVGWSDSVLVDHCTATNNGWDMPWNGNGPVGIWTYESNNVTIQYCISYKNKTHKGAKDGGGFDFDGGVTNSVIQYCLSYENEGAGYGLFQYAGASLWYNNAVRYCVSINDATTTEGSGAIFVWNGSNDTVQLADCFVYNNAVYSPHAPAVQFEPASLNKNFFFFNNIFIGSGPVVLGPSSGEKFESNIWWTSDKNKSITFRGYNDLETWSKATGQEKADGKLVGRQIDPQLQGPFQTTITDPYQLHTLTGFMLSQQSLLKNTGLKPKVQPSLSIAKNDFFGNPVTRDSNPDPGIHELKK